MKKHDHQSTPENLQAPNEHAPEQHAPEQTARRRFLQRTGTMAALLPLLSTPGFTACAAIPDNARSQQPPVPNGTALWYPTPANEAKVIEEGLPIGNGRLGALVGGDNAVLLQITEPAMVEPRTNAIGGSSRSSPVSWRGR